VSINTLEMLKMAEIIRKATVNDKDPVGVVYFDAPVPPGGIGKFSRALRLNSKNTSAKIVGENKADKNYPVVSAASIFAKVRRDEIINHIKEEYGDFGSGYCHDKKTITFLEEFYNKNKTFPNSIFRLKWSTLQRFCKKNIPILV